MILDGPSIEEQSSLYQAMILDGPSIEEQSSLYQANDTR